MTNPRALRVADRIQAELSEIVARRLKDPRRGFMTITAVEMSPDLKLARVFVSALTPEDLDQVMDMLEHAKGFLRRELGQRVELRHTPELIFRADRSAESGQRVAELLEELRREGELDGEGD